MSALTALLLPSILLLSAVGGVWKRVDVYQTLADGAGEGLHILLHILPPLIGLMTAVSMLRASGFLDWAAQAMGPLLSCLGIPPETVGLLLVRPMSGSAALGLGAELMEHYGPDSLIGRTAAVMLGSTETTFYTVSVYFGAVGIRNTRYAIPAALCADVVGFLAAAWAVRLFFPGN
ncbi:MAG: spore maturation protein [Clostridiales bacterium]|nr:spore maturation protein [Clostridiales bacterium]